MHYLLLLLLLGLAGCSYYSETFRFSSNTRYQHNGKMLEQSKTFREIENPMTLYCISEIDFNQPFSLNMDDQLLYRPETREQTLKIRMENTFGKNFKGVSVKWIVTTELIGMNTYDILLNYQHPSIPINYNLAVKPLNEETIRTGYFVTSFSNSSILSSLSEISTSSYSYTILFNPKQMGQYIKLTYFMFDVSPITGCIQNNVRLEKPLDIASVGYISKIPFQTDIYRLGGVSKIKGDRAVIRQSSNEVQISDYLNVEYFSLLLDTTCTNNAAPYISADVVKPTIGSLETLANSLYPISGPSILPIVVPYQNSSLNLPTIPSIPQVNGSGHVLPIPTTPISEVVLSNQTLSSMIQGVQDLPAPTITSPQEEDDDDIEPSDTVITTVTQTETVFSNPQPAVAPIPTLRRQQVTSITSRVRENIAISESTYSISAWNILGYILLIWIGVSLIAIPFLCCALRSVKADLSSSVEMVDRIEYDAQFNRGTDTRLIGNQVVVEGSPELVGNIKPRNSLPSIPSEITVELVGPRNSTDPNSDAFKSDKSSEINNPLPSLIKKEEVLTYEQLFQKRKSMERSFEKEKKMSGGQSMLEVSKNLDDSKSEKLSSHLSKDPSSNMDSISKAIQIKAELEPSKILEDIPVEQIRYFDQQPKPEEQDDFDIKLSTLSKPSEVNNPFSKVNDTQRQNQDEEESNNDYKSCYQPQSSLFNKEQSQISRLDNQPSSRITEKIGNLFGDYQNQPNEQIDNTFKEEEIKQEQIKYDPQNQSFENSNPSNVKGNQPQSSLPASIIKDNQEEKEQQPSVDRVSAGSSSEGSEEAKREQEQPHSQSPEELEYEEKGEENSKE